MPSDQKPTCFVIAPIGEQDTDVRKRSDKVLKHIFKKALSDKYEVIRADDIDEPGMITSQVLRAVQDSYLVVADLTGHNPNVFYELAVRHAIEKPIIHVIEPRLSKIPFDVAGFRTIEFDLTDPDSIESAVEQLRKQAAQAAAGKWGETPVRLANIMRPTQEDSSEMLLLKQAVEGISNVSARLTSVEEMVRAIDHPDYIWHTDDLRRELGTAKRSFADANVFTARALGTSDSGTSEPLPAGGTGVTRLSTQHKFAYLPRSKRGAVVESPSKPDPKKRR